MSLGRGTPGHRTCHAAVVLGKHWGRKLLWEDPGPRRGGYQVAEALWDLWHRRRRALRAESTCVPRLDKRVLHHAALRIYEDYAAVPRDLAFPSGAEGTQPADYSALGPAKGRFLGEYVQEPDARFVGGEADFPAIRVLAEGVHGEESAGGNDYRRCLSDTVSEEDGSGLCGALLPANGELESQVLVALWFDGHAALAGLDSFPAVKGKLIQFQRRWASHNSRNLQRIKTR